MRLSHVRAFGAIPVESTKSQNITVTSPRSPLASGVEAAVTGPVEDGVGAFALGL